MMRVNLRHKGVMARCRAREKEKRLSIGGGSADVRRQRQGGKKPWKSEGESKEGGNHHKLTGGAPTRRRGGRTRRGVWRTCR